MCHYVNELNELRKTVREEIKRCAPRGQLTLLDLPTIWLLYPNFDYSTVCVEVFTPRYGNEPASCMMWPLRVAQKFAASPDWDVFGKKVTFDRFSKEQFLDGLVEVLNQISEASDDEA